MEKELKCPKCGSKKIEIDDTFDSEYTYIDGKPIHFDFCCGGCKDCGALLQWREVYPFAGYDQIEED